MNRIPYAEKHIENKLSRIGAKVVKATEMTHEANRLLLDAQTEIADLYESLGDILAMPDGENEQGKASKNNQSSLPQD